MPLALMPDLWPLSFSIRKFEYADQINWLTIQRPDAYHLFIN
ncbi:hypothetical protein YPPY13_4049 [Yersinia pestis PY-13]|uniref:Uncharacterized protein n=1 Tax=Yersinia pestis PY-08 TaxID=992134 RepID=A0AB72ZFM8_YERPE|nr:hypothetical protein YpF1991016_3855 [Yersinia pestis biovar Orientalis str. F1991016]EDR42097.1 hypothetical protein YpE1979001_4592 [Yersinia pestis biovar Antiqua str. E1979001]EDR57385.1 hypothetical protein YpMG051020_4185 [Yersinia pestis biovar Orientalis str. MG05-1020]EDR61299.1 hypothetical protein YpUG050454_3826 [Yersinia pestis biovar Antiqua str. UG05-0454]EFA47794.1 conserved domain protein [Yersinia pestis KIM D27]EIQ84831.1 hypothetical protein YPPY01_3971 [Yersinia pestis 